MRINKSELKHLRSLKQVSIINPNGFTVLAGVNASGKSNIFEAIMFSSILASQSADNALIIFGAYDNLVGRYVKDSVKNISAEPETNKEALSRMLRPGAQIEGPENIRYTPFDRLNQLKRNTCIGIGNKKVFANQILKFGLSEKHAANHPNCTSAQYFINN